MDHETHSSASSEEMDLDIRRIIDAARGIWTHRLIDPSRANSLLFYRDLKVGTLDLSTEPEAVGRLLAGEKLGIESLVLAGRRVAASDPVPRAQPQGEAQGSLFSALPENGDPVVRARAEAEARQKVRSALVALQRKALSNLEEKGIETLHLAMGMATWPASDGGRPYDAPVLLLPARIEARGRAGDDLRLAVAGEPQVNPVLLYVLEENYAIRINASAVLSECGGEDESGQWRL
ncbi:MAG: DUF4011 domain-containing protein, partial [Nitrospirae bacterium]|nr:DUF4011 domain-containing protein [Nitrospirota bacterium]